MHIESTGGVHSLHSRHMVWFGDWLTRKSTIPKSYYFPRDARRKHSFSKTKNKDGQIKKRVRGS